MGYKQILRVVLNILRIVLTADNQYLQNKLDAYRQHNHQGMPDIRK